MNDFVPLKNIQLAMILLVIIIGFFAIWDVQMARVKVCSIEHQESL